MADLPAGTRADTDDTSVLRNPRFRRIWAAGFLTSMMRWLDLLVLGVFVFDMTDSAAKVAIVLLVRMLPRFVFGIALGTLADRVNRQYLWVAALATLSGMSLLLGILIMTDAITYGLLLVVVFISGIFWATEFPVRRAMIGDVVPHAAIGRAFGTDWTTDSFNRMIGPALGGALIVTVGAEGCYFLMSAAFGFAALVAMSLDYTPHVRDEVAQSPAQSLMEGLRRVRRTRLLLAVMLVTVLFNL
ncbi:MAG TPA: MFS transporter, partial [Dehalococcoidia bacterium]|nr:MFS transporter [Dehalococcoidia bacterium]